MSENQEDSQSNGTSLVVAGSPRGRASTCARRVLAAVLMTVVAIPVSGCLPPSPGPSGCAYEGLVRNVFTDDADWAVSIALRESNCEPLARNSSGSSGLFQLLLPLHDDLLTAVCPQWDPSVSWSIPWCAVAAAHLLYEGSGRAPWAL